MESKKIAKSTSRNSLSTIDIAKGRKKQKIRYNFGDKHREYIRNCHDNMYNILEGAVRSGKTVDNVYAFAHELMITPDRIHLATGSTMGNAKLNIGDANGFGLEWIFRGQCKWTKYKDMDALVIKGPYTGGKKKIVIFAGASGSPSYKKIRGNSYGMWIATEINLHHDNTIKEAFNRTLASRNRKIFWDLNPDHPKAAIYTDYIDKYANKAAQGTLIGGFNYQHFTIFDNQNISKQRLDEIISQYDEGSIWYIRDILGKRSIAEGLIYSKLATSLAVGDGRYLISRNDVIEMVKRGEILKTTVGIDFGGNGSGHAFVAAATTLNYEKIIVLRSERHFGDDIDPEVLGELFIAFLMTVIRDYNVIIQRMYADSAEQVLIRGLRNTLNKHGMGDIKISNAMKGKITDRIFLTTSMVAQDRLLCTEDTETFKEAVSTATWDSGKLDLVRRDDGTSDIDTLDGFEYCIERDYRKYIDAHIEKMGGEIVT